MVTVWQRIKKFHHCHQMMYDSSRMHDSQVKPEESVVLVLLIANAISVSLLDMHVRASNEAPIKNRKKYAKDAHLGEL